MSNVKLNTRTIDECPIHRAEFDHATKELYAGDSMLQVESILRTWASTSPQQGSYAKILKIMANEVAKVPERVISNEPK